MDTATLHIAAAHQPSTADGVVGVGGFAGVAGVAAAAPVAGALGDVFIGIDPGRQLPLDAASHNPAKDAPELSLPLPPQAARARQNTDIRLGR